MGTRHFLLVLIILCVYACRPKGPDEIVFPTKICIKTSHHGQPIPGAKVWVKYNSDTFPGYDKPPSFFDATFDTGSDARGCVEPVPEGRHWLLAFGYDSLHFPYYVYGAVRVDVSVNYKPVVDTILYVTE